MDSRGQFPRPSPATKQPRSDQGRFTATPSSSTSGPRPQRACQAARTQSSDDAKTDMHALVDKHAQAFHNLVSLLPRPPSVPATVPLVPPRVWDVVADAIELVFIYHGRRQGARDGPSKISDCGFMMFGGLLSRQILFEDCLENGAKIERLRFIRLWQSVDGKLQSWSKRIIRQSSFDRAQPSDIVQCAEECCSAAWFKHILNFVYDHEQIQDLIVLPSDDAERKEFRSAFGKAAHELALALALSWISVARMPPADALCIQPDSISTRHGSMVRVSRMSEGELRPVLDEHRRRQHLGVFAACDLTPALARRIDLLGIVGVVETDNSVDDRSSNKGECWSLLRLPSAHPAYGGKTKSTTSLYGPLARVNGIIYADERPNAEFGLPARSYTAWLRITCDIRADCQVLVDYGYPANT